MTSSAPAAPRFLDSPLATLLATICIMGGTFMQMLDTTIANVALPYMQGSLQASRDQITWVLTSYIIASAILTGPVGWLAARFGRREVFLFSVAGFTIASMLCGLAQSLDQMILFRLIQGMMGAPLSPLSQAIILDRYPLEQRGKLMGLWSVVVMTGPILGPTIGGFLTDAYSWRWVFFVNAPVGILSFVGIYFLLYEPARPRPPRFDWWGFAYLSLGLASLQLCLDRGQDQDWFSSPEIVIEAVVSGLSFYLFIVQMWTTENAFLDKKMLRDRNYVAGLLLGFVIGQLLLATSALLPPYLQTLGGYSVFDTGLLLAPRGLGTMIVAVLLGRIAMKMDVRLLMIAGALVLLWTMWEMKTWTPSVSAWTVGSLSFIQGAGMGMIFMPSNLYTFATLPQSFRTEASSLYNLVRNVGSAIGVSATTTVLTMNTQTAYSAMAAHATPFNRALSVNAPSMMLNPALPFGANMFHAMIMRQSSIVAYTDTFLFMFYTGLPALLIIFALKKVNLLARPAAPAEVVE